MKRRRRRVPPHPVQLESNEPGSVMVQQFRQQYMPAFDQLPKDLRQAISECPFDVHFLLPGKGIIVENVIRRIKAIKSPEDAERFTLDHMPRQRLNIRYW